jgi:hypothetical protein
MSLERGCNEMKNLFKKVENPLELMIFNRIWMAAWEEKGYELEFTETADRCLVEDELGLFVGTVEFIPYVPLNDIDQVFPFHSIEPIQNHSGKIVEIDKLALKKEYRGKNLDRLLAVISQYTEYHDYHFCIGLIEPKLFIALKKFYRLPIEELGRRMYYKGDDVIPMIIDVSYANQNKNNFPWLMKCLEEVSRLPQSLNTKG